MACVTTLPAASTGGAAIPDPLNVLVTNPVEILDNKRTAILKANDRVQVFTYADFGTIDQRITQIDYSSATIYPGETARRVFTYVLETLPTGRQVYRRTNSTWSII